MLRIKKKKKKKQGRKKKNHQNKLAQQLGSVKKSCIITRPVLGVPTPRRGRAERKIERKKGRMDVDGEKTGMEGQGGGGL